MTPTERTLSLDLEHLSEEDIQWLHKLKNLAQNLNMAMFLKSKGITKEKK